MFADLEVVRCAMQALHAEFDRRIGRDGDDPEDVLAPVGLQLEWMREAGRVDVDCQWRWRGFASPCSSALTLSWRRRGESSPVPAR